MKMVTKTNMTMDTVEPILILFEAAISSGGGGPAFPAIDFVILTSLFAAGIATPIPIPNATSASNAPTEIYMPNAVLMDMTE